MTLTKPKIASAWKSYRAGFTLARLAKRLRCAPATVRAALVGAGKKLRPPGRPAKARTTSRRLVR